MLVTQRRPLRRRRPLHRRRRQPGQCASPHQPKASRDPRLLGMRSRVTLLQALTLLDRHAAAVPWRRIGERWYSLHQLNEAAADAEAMRITKALVDPWAA